MDIRGYLVTSCHQENRWYPLLCTVQVTHQLSKLPSGYGLNSSVLASAMHGISLNSFSSLTIFFSHFSSLALSAMALPHKATFLQHSTRQRPGRRKGREMLMSSLVGVTSTYQTGCLLLLGLAGGVCMLLCDLTSTPQISNPASPKRLETDILFSDAISSFVQQTPQGRRTAAAQAVLQAVTGLAIPGNACQVWASWTPVIGQSCCLLAPCGLLTFHLD